MEAEEVSDRLAGLYDEREEVFRQIAEGIGPVSVALLEYDRDYVNARQVCNDLFKRNAASLPERFCSRMSEDSVDKVNNVLEYGVSQSDALKVVENRRFPTYSISGYSHEEHERLVQAAEEALEQVLEQGSDGESSTMERERGWETAREEPDF